MQELYFTIIIYYKKEIRRINKMKENVVGKVKPRVKNIAELAHTKQVLAMVDKTIGLQKPRYDIKKYLDKIGIIYKKDPKLLERYLAIFSVWENYFAEQLVLMEAISGVAESQMRSEEHTSELQSRQYLVCRL